MKTVDLTRDWTLSFTHPLTGEVHRIPATVPGNVELDLLRAGLLTEDPLPPDQVDAAHWVDLADWDYENDFTFDGLPEGTALAELVLEGIDTVAAIFLNGEPLYECRNMFIAHKIDVTDHLKPGVNHLKIHITAAEYAARSLPPPPAACWTWFCRSASIRLRKARHVWGWDNSPHRVTAGVWRKVKLEFLPACRIVDVYAYTRRIVREEQSADLKINYTLAIPERDLSFYRLRVILSLAGERVLDETFPVPFTSGELRGLRVNQARYWQPAGAGEPVLYDLIVQLEKAGRVIDVHTHKFGIRTIRLERSETTTPEGQGEFQFYCNEEKLYVRGTNWKPLSPYHSETPQKLHRALDLAMECHCNMIRVWGGGIYEDDDFFDYCDAHGLLVWQDFMFACEFPPQDEAFCREVAAEAEAVIVKLRNHPSLALWCGDNEDDDAFLWGDSMNRTLSPKDNRINREILAEAVRNFDPSRDYLPSSPYVSDVLVDHTFRRRSTDDILAVLPEQHIYTDGPKLPPGGFRAFFRRSAAHFSSETGPIGINAMSETPEFVARELPRLKRLWNADPNTLPKGVGEIHQSDHYCTIWCRSVQQVMRATFGRDFSPDCPEELVAAVNFYVADLFKFVIESWRVQKFRRTGVIWWSLLDMWPMAFNYSVVDSAFRKKLPFHFIRLAQQPLAVMGKDPETPGAAPACWVVNDTGLTQNGVCRITAEDGTQLSEIRFSAGPNQVKALGDLPLFRGDACFFHWRTDSIEAENFYLAPGEPRDFSRCCRLAQKIALMK